LVDKDDHEGLEMLIEHGADTSGVTGRFGLPLHEKTIQLLARGLRNETDEAV
jgi:hypothetical protein